MAQPEEVFVESMATVRDLREKTNVTYSGQETKTYPKIWEEHTDSMPKVPSGDEEKALDDLAGRRPLPVELRVPTRALTRPTLTGFEGIPLLTDYVKPGEDVAFTLSQDGDVQAASADATVEFDLEVAPVLPSWRTDPEVKDHMPIPRAWWEVGIPPRIGYLVCFPLLTASSFLVQSVLDQAH